MSETAHLSQIYDSFADAQSPDVLELHDYWRSKLAGRAMPHPADIDPTEMRRLLASIVMADYSGTPPRGRYRLVGSMHAHYAGQDFTGRFVDEMTWSEKDFVLSVHDRLCRTRAPVFGRYQWDFRDHLPGFCEFGFFPLSADGVTVTRGIGIDDFAGFEQHLGRGR